MLYEQNKEPRTDKYKDARPGRLFLKTRIKIRKFANDEEYKKNNPYEIGEDEGNIGLNEGIQKLWDLGIYATTAGYYGTGSCLGVGAATTAESAADTGLAGGASVAFATCCAGYPSRSSQTVSWLGSYGATEALFPWNEFTVVNATSDAGANLIRKLSEQGTKVSGQTWELTISISMS